MEKMAKTKSAASYNYLRILWQSLVNVSRRVWTSLLDIDRWLMALSFTLKLVGKIMSSLGMFYCTPGCSLSVLSLVEVSLLLGGKSDLPSYVSASVEGM